VADKLKTLIPGLTAVNISAAAAAAAGVFAMPLIAVMPAAVGECRRKGDLGGGTA